MATPDLQSQSHRQALHDKLHTELLLAAVGAGVVIVLSWVFFISLAVFHYDLMLALGYDGESRELALQMAWVFSACAVVFLMLKAKKVRTLKQRGAVTTGTVTGISPLGRGLMTPVTIAYTVAHQQYSTRIDMLRDYVVLGKTYDVIYDPKKPSWCVVIK